MNYQVKHTNSGLILQSGNLMHCQTFVKAYRLNCCIIEKVELKATNKWLYSTTKEVTIGLFALSMFVTLFKVVEMFAVGLN